MKINNVIIGSIIVSFVIFSDGTLFLNNQSDPPNFDFGCEENEVLTYKILSFNKDLASEYLGFSDITFFLGDFAYVGAYRFVRIDKIEGVNDLISLNNSQLCDGWKLNISSWEWVTNHDWELRQGDPDEIYLNLKIYRNPEDLGKIFYDVEEMSYSQKYILDYLNFPYVFPIDIEDYLSRINWAENWTVSGKIISIRYKEINGNFVKKVHTFNSDGFLKRTKVLTDDNRVIYSYVLEEEYIPILTLVYFFLIAGFIIVGIIYVFIKKI